MQLSQTLSPYLFCHIPKGIPANDGITHQEDMCVWVAERSEAIITFIASRVM